MSIRDNVSPEILATAKKFTSWIENGAIQKQFMPNNACDFDEEKILANADALSKSGAFDQIIKGAYDRNK